jgi:hypothetical protein
MSETDEDPFKWVADAPDFAYGASSNARCPHCKVPIAPSPTGFYCKCSEWRLVSDPVDQTHVADRRPL